MKARSVLRTVGGFDELAVDGLVASGIVESGVAKPGCCHVMICLTGGIR